MSRTNQTDKPRNPAQKFLRWKQADKCWSYWDKDAEERRKIPANTPFIVLDILSTATGFNDSKNCGIWANEVRNVGDILEVKDKDGAVASGPWRKIKEKVHYAKFAASVYAFAKINGTPELVNFQLSGCALGPWIDFRNDFKGNVMQDGVVISVTGTKAGKKGSVTFNSPVFEVVSNEISPESEDQANHMDEELQSFLSGYLADSPQARAAKEHSERMEAVQPDAPEQPDVQEFPEDDVPF